MWEKEKMLVTSIFSFSHIVFYFTEEKIVILAMFNLLSVNPLNWYGQKFCHPGKG